MHNTPDSFPRSPGNICFIRPLLDVGLAFFGAHTAARSLWFAKSVAVQSRAPGVVGGVGLGLVDHALVREILGLPRVGLVQYKAEPLSHHLAIRFFALPSFASVLPGPSRGRTLTSYFSATEASNQSKEFLAPTEVKSPLCTLQPSDFSSW